MGKVLKYYMWGYQEHFLMSVESLISSLMAKLQISFPHRVFLFGLKNDEANDGHPICVCPDDSLFQPELFNGVVARTNLLRTADPASTLHHSHPIAAQQRAEQLNMYSLQAAVKAIVDEQLASREWETFTTYPMHVGAYLVVAIVQLDQKSIQSLNPLHRQFDNEESPIRRSLARSLFDAVVTEILNVCATYLQTKDPGSGLFVGSNTDELLRAAGTRLMRTAASATKELLGLNSLFEACTNLSTLPYEGADNHGHIIFTRKEHPDIETQVIFKEETAIHDARAIRKLLQLTTPHSSLLCTAESAYALGRVHAGYDPSKEDIFTIRFTRRFVWELWHHDIPLMRVEYGKPALPLPRFDDTYFAEMLHRQFPKITERNVSHLTRVAHAAAGLHHGTMLVISQQAAKEARRLAKQATPVKPFKLTEENIATFTDIDGALIIDTTGRCHAIGAILDGPASDRCDPSRGARYNSAIKYTYLGKKLKPCLILVKSDDGMTDIIPHLRAQIYASDLMESLNRFRSQATQRPIKWKEYFAANDEMRRFGFYFSPEQCEEINRLEQQATAVLIKDGPVPTRGPLRPHPDMNPSYFVREHEGSSSVNLR